MKGPNVRCTSVSAIASHALEVIESLATQFGAVVALPARFVTADVRRTSDDLARAALKFSQDFRDKAAGTNWHMTSPLSLSLSDRLRLLFGTPLYVRFDSPDGQCHASCGLSGSVQRDWPNDSNEEGPYAV